MYDCFKLGFYSQLGLSNKKEIPELNSLIKAAYENLKNTQNPNIETSDFWKPVEESKQYNLKTPNNPNVAINAFQSNPTFPLPSGDPTSQLSSEVLQNAYNYAPNFKNRFPRLPQRTSDLTGTPYGRTVNPWTYNVAETIQPAAGAAGLGVAASQIGSQIFPNTRLGRFMTQGAGRHASNPFAQTLLGAGILGPESIRASRMIGDRLQVNPTTQKVMDVAAPLATGAATAGASHALAQGTSKVLGSVLPKKFQPLAQVAGSVAGVVPFVAPSAVDRYNQASNLPNPEQWAKNLSTPEAQSDVMAGFLKTYRSADDAKKAELLKAFWSNPQAAEQNIKLLQSSKYSPNPAMRAWAQLLQANRPESDGQQVP